MAIILYVVYVCFDNSMTIYNPKQKVSLIQQWTTCSLLSLSVVTKINYNFLLKHFFSILLKGLLFPTSKPKGLPLTFYSIWIVKLCKKYLSSHTWQPKKTGSFEKHCAINDYSATSADAPPSEHKHLFVSTKETEEAIIMNMKPE